MSNRNIYRRSVARDEEVSNTRCRHDKPVWKCNLCNRHLNTQHIASEHKIIPSRGSMSNIRSSHQNNAYMDGGHIRFVQMKMDKDKKSEENSHLKYTNEKAVECTKILLKERITSNLEMQKVQKELSMANQCITAAKFIIKKLQEEKQQVEAKVDECHDTKEKLAILVNKLKKARKIEAEEMENVKSKNLSFRKEMEVKEERLEEKILELKSSEASKEEWLGEMTNKIRLQDCEMDVVRQVNDEYSQKIADLQHHVQCTEGENDNLTQKLECFTGLKSNFEKMSIENEDLVNKLSVSTCSEMEWRKKVFELEAENQKLKISTENYKQTIVELNKENELDRDKFEKLTDSSNQQRNIKCEQFADKIKNLEAQLQKKVDLVIKSDSKEKTTLAELQKQMEIGQKHHNIERKQFADKIKNLEAQLQEKVDLVNKFKSNEKSPLGHSQKQLEDDLERSLFTDKIKELKFQLQESLNEKQQLKSQLTQLVASSHSSVENTNQPIYYNDSDNNVDIEKEFLPDFSSDSNSGKEESVNTGSGGKQKRLTKKKNNKEGLDTEGFRWIIDSSSDNDSADEWERDREIYRYLTYH